MSNGDIISLEEVLQKSDILGYYTNNNKVHISLHHKSDVNSIISEILIHSDCKRIIDKGIKLIVEL